MYTPEDIQWLRQRIDLDQSPFDASKLPRLPEEFQAYRRKYRKAQDAVTEKLRRESETNMSPALRQRLNERIEYLRNQPA